MARSKLPENCLEVGTTGKGEVVINHPRLDTDEHGQGYIIFSPEQARHFVLILSKHIQVALQERERLVQ